MFSIRILRIFICMIGLINVGNVLAEQPDADAKPIGDDVANAERVYAKTVELPTFVLSEVELLQDPTGAIPEAFLDPGARLCRPFCVQPEAKPGVELFLLEDFPRWAEKINSGQAIVIDMRTPDWSARGTLPGAINIPYTDFTGPVNRARARMKSLAGKPVVAFCNGWWCGQSNAGLGALVELGYSGKLYSFRGGVQDWVDAGLPLVSP